MRRKTDPQNSFVSSTPLKTLFKIGLCGVLILLWFLFLRSNHSYYWSSVHSHIIAPFEKWPKELTSFGSRGAYLYSIGLILLIDLNVLGKKSALAKVISFDPSVRTDLVIAPLAFLGFIWVIPTIITGGLTAIIPKFFSQWSTNIVAEIPSDYLQWIAYFVIADFLLYWHHRTLHKFRPLWEFHAFHHSATSFTVFTGNRVHPVETILKVPFLVLPMMFIGYPDIWVIGTIYYVRRLIDMAQHSFVPFTYGWFGKWVVFSPVGHRIHHSIEVKHFDSNYGDILTIWDHIFGTWYSGDDINEEIGIPENEFNHNGVVADLCRPFKKASQRFD